MRELKIGMNEAGQRLDKYLKKYLAEAPQGFLFKMIRKKNITLNGGKCTGAEKLSEGDVVKLWLSDETIEKFRKEGGTAAGLPDPKKAGLPERIIYEDGHVLAYDKPAGMLSQKAEPGDVSANEYLLSWCGGGEEAFTPSVVNRLDRNTTGLILFGKTLPALQELSALLKDRDAEKYYLAAVAGHVAKGMEIRGYLRKDARTNRVAVLEKPSSHEDREIRTACTPVAYGDGITLLRVHLITGRTHQIRAHLASVGHPVLGDPKYGEREANRRCQSLTGCRHQLLHAFELTFPETDGVLKPLSGKTLRAPVPEAFVRLFPEAGDIARGAVHETTERKRK